MKCINTSHPEFKRLISMTNVPVEILTAFVSHWMEKNNTDKMPTALEITRMLDELSRTDNDSFKIEDSRFSKLFPSHKVKSSDVLMTISESDSPMADIASKLLSFTKMDVDISIVKDKPSTLGQYFQSGRIQINYDGDFSMYKNNAIEPTIIHEVLHAYTSAMLADRQSPYVKDLEKLLEHVRKFTPLIKDRYPLKNIDEFLVGIFTRPKFIQDLKRIPPLVGMDTKLSSAWDSLIDWFKRILGYAEGTALKQAIDISSHIIERGQPIFDKVNDIAYDNDISEVYSKNELYRVYKNFNLVFNNELVSYSTEAKAAARIKELNESSPYYKFTYRKTYPRGRFTIFIRKPKTLKVKQDEIDYYNSEKYSNDRAGEPDFDGLYNIGVSKPFETLDSRLTHWMKLMGITMEKVSEITGKDGNTGINAAAKITEGVIQYVEGKLQQDTIPEEISHFMTIILKENNRGLYNSLAYKAKNSDVYGQVKRDYEGLYSTEEQFIDEAIGKIMAQHLSGEVKLSLMDRVKAFLNKLFKSLGISMSVFNEEIDPYVKATDMILKAENAEFNKNTLESVKNKYKGVEYYDLSDSQQQNYEKFTKIFSDFQNPDKSPIEKTKDGYRHKATGKITKRVTETVKEYYKSIFGESNKEGSKMKLAAVHGTKLHFAYEMMSKSYLKDGKFPTHDEILESIYNELKDHQDFKEYSKDSSVFRFGKEDKYSNASYENMKRGIANLIDSIKEKGDDIKKITGSKNDTKFFFELTLYDELEDTAGTIDMVVVYPDGSIANYDYKNMIFKTVRGKVVNDYIAPFKETAFSIQLEKYKDLERHVLTGLGGNVTFAESRIIPIDMRLNYKNPEIIHSVDLGDVDNKGKFRRHLVQIPVARELTGHSTIDEGLTAMYNLQDKISKMIDDNPKDATLRLRLQSVRDTIQTFLVYDNADDIAKKLETIKEEYEIRMKSSPNKNLTMQLIEEYYSYAKVYYKLIEGLIERSEELGKSKDKKVSEANKTISDSLKKVYFDTQSFIKELNHKTRDIVNDLDEQDIDESTKELSFFGSMFKQISQINHPIFRRLSTLIGNVKTDVQREMDEFNDKLRVKVDALEDFAKKNNTSVKAIYDRIINPNTGNLVTKFKSELYEKKAEAQENEDLEWMKDNLEIEYNTSTKMWSYSGEAQTRFLKAKEKHRSYINMLYQGDDKRMIDIRKQAMADWNYKYDISLNDKSLFNKKNWFLMIKDKESNYSSDWKYISNNKEVKDYYDFYVNSNKHFADITGKDIRDNFVANIHADIIDSAMNNGLGQSLNFRNHMRDMLKVRQFDTIKGAIDPETGNVIQNIPLMYYDGIRKSASASERRDIENQLINEGFKRGEEDYLNEFKVRLRRLERKKAIASKSKDLSRSLSLFAEAAYTNHYFKESESMAVALLNYMKSTKSGTVAEDYQGKTITDKFTNKVKEIFKISSGDVRALESFINLYWYGQTIQSKDALVHRKIKDSEGNVIDEEYFSSIKGIKKMMQYISLKSLGLNAFSAFGNAVGIGANTYFLGRENRELTKPALIASLKDFKNDREKFSALADLIKPYTHGVNYEAANNLTSSKLNKILTEDNMYILMKNPDIFIDKIVANSMARTYGVNESGGIVRLALDPKAKPVIDFLTKDNDKYKLGLTREQMTIFRRKVQASSTKIKGSMPEENKALWTTNLITVMMGQFRGWMPGLIRARFKALQHDSDLDELDVGRYKVFIGELLGDGFSPKNILNLANRIIPFYDKRTKGLKKISVEASKKYFEEFRTTNPVEYNNYLKGVQERYPDLSLTEIRDKAFEEFMEMREAKVRAFIAELKALMYISMLMLGIGAAAPDDDEFLKAVTRNSMLMLQRGYLELSFFYDMNTPKTLLSNPIPAMRFVFDAQKAMFNFIDETNSLVRNIEDNRDHTPYMYYTTTKLLPLGGMLNRVFDPFDNYDHY